MVTSSSGPGFFISRDSSGKIDGDTIVGNTATSGGGGLFLGHHSAATVRNSILWNNSTPGGYEVDVSDHAAPSEVTVSYTDLEGGSPSIENNFGTVNLGLNNTDSDPLFVDAAAGNYHITSDSPYRSVGDRTAPGLPDVDFEGDARTGLYALPGKGGQLPHPW